MARSRNPVSTYRKHATNGRAVIDVYRVDGKRTTINLPGLHGSEESLAEFQRYLSLLQANGGRLPAPKAPNGTADVTVAELVARFLDEKVAIDYVDANGEPTTERQSMVTAVRPLVRLFGSTIAREFDAGNLEIVRQAMLTGSWTNDEEKARLAKLRKMLGWCRGNVNKCVSRLRGLFRWAVTKKIVPSSVVVDLQCLAPIKRGRAGARESKPVLPVAPEVVDATLPHLPPIVADMVRVQLLTGCRPGELFAMKGADIDRDGPVWIYRPTTHKTEHLGHKRAIALGPQAQFILRRYLKDDPAAYLFSPAEQDVLVRAARRRARKSKVPPSQVDRSKPGAKRKPRHRFTAHSYNRAISRGSRKAGVEHWHAHRLRHTAALLVAREHGVEAARSVLGHKTLNVTLHYSGIDTQRAADVALRMG